MPRTLVFSVVGLHQFWLLISSPRYSIDDIAHSSSKNSPRGSGRDSRVDHTDSGSSVNSASELLVISIPSPQGDHKIMNISAGLVTAFRLIFGIRVLNWKWI